MVFELGKYYEHTTGSRLYIVGCMASYGYGMGYVGEDEWGNFHAVGKDEDNASNFSEITREEFIGPTKRAWRCSCGSLAHATDAD